MKNIIFLLEQEGSEEIEKDFFKIIIEKLKEINEYYELANLLWIAIIIFVIGLLLLFNKHRVNKKSKKEYEKNEQNGKFINELYIELGNCNEKLRYMYFNKKWKSRIKKEFKVILKTNIGKMLSKECNIKFYNYITFNGLYKSLKKCSDYLENCWKRNINKDENQNYEFYLAMNSYYIKDVLFPKDSPYYIEDMKRLFPRSVRKQMDKVYENGDYEKLKDDIDEQVRIYFYDTETS